MSGWPGWRRTISLGDIWNDPELSGMEKAWEISKRLEKSAWYKESFSVSSIIDELVWISDPQDTERDDDVRLEDWNYFWDQMYDIADHERVWIDLTSKED